MPTLPEPPRTTTLIDLAVPAQQGASTRGDGGVCSSDRSLPMVAVARDRTPGCPLGQPQRQITSLHVAVLTVAPEKIKASSAPHPRHAMSTPLACSIGPWLPIMVVRSRMNRRRSCSTSVVRRASCRFDELVRQLGRVRRQYKLGMKAGDPGQTDCGGASANVPDRFGQHGPPGVVAEVCTHDLARLARRPPGAVQQGVAAAARPRPRRIGNSR